MKAKRSHEHAGFAVVRTPLLPLCTLEQLGRPGHAWALRNADDNLLEEAIARELTETHECLSAVASRPQMREALAIASPDTLAALNAASATGGPVGDRLARTLYRYVARAAYRCTPFGTFAGSSRADIAPATSLALDADAAHRRVCRLDMGHLTVILDFLLAMPELRHRCTYCVNSSLHEAAGRYHYVETTRLPNGTLDYALTAIDASPDLAALVRAAEGGAALATLAAVLIDDGVAVNEAHAYLDDVIASQVLVPELAIAITGEDSLAQVLSDLGRMDFVSPQTEALAAVHEAISLFNVHGGGPLDELIAHIGHLLRAGGLPVPERNVLQVDLVKHAPAATLASSLVDDLTDALSVMQHINGNYDELSEFAHAFSQRYEDAEVPLLEALDDDVGVGLPRDDGRVKEDKSRLQLNRDRQSALASLLFKTRGAHELVLSAGDLVSLHDRFPRPLPESVGVMASVLGGWHDDPHHGDVRLLWQGASGPPGTAFLGRFCHTDARLREDVDRFGAAEATLHPDALVAEIVHLPQGRIGNVLCRPVMRAHELVYLGRSGAPRDLQIPVRDLTVMVREGRIILRSRRLDREIVPRLTSAHNFRSTVHLPVYRFLGLLQTHGRAKYFGWSWGVLANLSFLPRVRYGRVILARATWLVMRGDLAAVRLDETSHRYRAFWRWQEARGIPRHVVVVEGDNQLPVDLHSALGVDVFLRLTDAAERTTVQELLPGPDHLVVGGPGGQHTNEVIVPLLSSSVTAARSVPHRPTHVARRQRSVSLGGDWLYAKLFCGWALNDQVLRKIVAPLFADAGVRGSVTKWFFVRYADPEPHLRLRFHGDPCRLQTTVLPALTALTASAMDSGLLWRVQFDTYEREHERYGGPAGMNAAELLFSADSDAVLALVTAAPGLSREERQLSAMLGYDDLFGAFGWPFATRIAFLERLTRDASSDARRVWGERYRRDKALLTTVVTQRSGWPAPPEVHLAYELRVARLTEVHRQLTELASLDHLSCPLDDLCGSYLHMHANRTMREFMERPQETMTYDLLRRTYLSIAARARAGHERSQSVSDVPAIAASPQAMVT